MSFIDNKVYPLKEPEPPFKLEIDFSKPQYYMPGGNFDSLCVVSSDKITIHKHSSLPWENFDFNCIQNNPNLLGEYFEEKPVYTIDQFCRVFITDYPLESYGTYMSHEDLQGVPIESSGKITKCHFSNRILKDNDKYGNINKYAPTVTLKHNGRKFIYHNQKPWCRGKYILIHLHGNEYMSVGCRVNTFQVPDNDYIIYASPGTIRNGYPYPYAIGTKYGYCPEENLYIDKTSMGNVKDPTTIHYSGYNDSIKKKKNIMGFKFSYHKRVAVPRGAFKELKIESIPQ